MQALTSLAPGLGLVQLLGASVGGFAVADFDRDGTVNVAWAAPGDPSSDALPGLQLSLRGELSDHPGAGGAVRGQIDGGRQPQQRWPTGPGGSAGFRRRGSGRTDVPRRRRCGWLRADRRTRGQQNPRLRPAADRPRRGWGRRSRLGAPQGRTTVYQNRSAFGTTERRNGGGGGPQGGGAAIDRTAPKLSVGLHPRRGLKRDARFA